MENKKSDLTNPHSAEKARAEDLSGLYPVFEEFSNGVDIQPLDDIAAEEMIPFEDNTVFEAEENEVPEKTENKKSGKKKIIIRTVVILVVMIAAAVGAYNVFLRFNDFSHPAEAVYQKGDSVQVRLDNGKSFEIENVVEAHISKDGSRLVYSQNSTTKTGKLDLRLIELKKRSSVKNKGTLAVSGVDEGWSAGESCAYVYYTVTEEGAQHHYVYAAEEKENQPVVFDAAEVFVPPDGDIAYFTRETGQGTQLFRIRIGEKAAAIDYVSGVKAFSADNKLELFYTCANDDSTYRLYKIKGDSAPEEVAANVSEVYLDDYQPGGNLYYFVKSQAKLNWNDFITDEYADSDALMKKPERADYTYTVGFIFKREKVDESAYNLALQKYALKEKRDNIRQALNQEDLGLAVSSEYKVCVYDGERSRELAGGVRLENLAAFAKKGMPRIIVKKNGIGTGNKKISMDTLFETAETNGVELAADYAIQTLLSIGYNMNYGYKYIYYNGSNVHEYDFEPNYNTDGTTFLFGGKNSIYAAVKSDNIHYDVYYCKADESAVTQAKCVAQGVTSFEMAGDKLCLTVSAQNGNSDLYVCMPDGSNACVCENVVKYFINGDSLTALHGREGENAAFITHGELILFKDGKTVEIDGGVHPENIIIRDGKTAYIKNYEESYEDKNFGGGTLVIYKNNERAEIDGSVGTIFDVN